MFVNVSSVFAEVVIQSLIGTSFSSRLIPVPMVGFKELLCRLQIQEQMTKQHQTRVDVSVFAGSSSEQ